MTKTDLYELITKYLSRKPKPQQKMDEKKRGKKRAICDDVIFEISDSEMSPEAVDNGEPETKLSKSDIKTPDIEPVNQQNGTLLKVDSGISLGASESADNLNASFTRVSSSDSETECTVKQQTTVVLSNGNIAVNSTLQVGKDLSNLEDGELVGEANTDITDKSETKPEISSVPKPSISISFIDETTADLYRFKFLKFLQSFVELETDLDELTINVYRDSLLNPEEWLVVDDTLCINNEDDICSKETVKLQEPLSPSSNKHAKKKKDKKKKKEKSVFIVDTTPSSEDQSRHVTKYCSRFEIDVVEKTESNEENTFKLSAQTCFNCDGAHSLRECTQPKNFNKINAQRQKHKAQKQAIRYHLEEDEKYPHLKPGQTSEKLREALGLRKHELPPYIYQMRVLGYPPGWLEEAKCVYSELAMFDGDGKHVAHGVNKKQGLDPTKIIDYPGFNSPMGDKYKDEYKYYKVPPYSDKFGKEYMLEYFEKEYAKEQDDLQEHDMDVDNNFCEESNKNEDSVAEVLANPLVKEITKVEVGTSSPSLAYLEKVKEKLLDALDESNSNSNSNEEKPKVEEQSTDVNTVLKIEVSESGNESTPQMSPSGSVPLKVIKTSTFGTPILKSASPYLRLPNPDNFMKGVSPVINFENLPDATGKYEQMTGVLEKVRKTMKSIQKSKT